MSEIQGRAVRKDDKYANENISETLSSRFPLAMGRLFFLNVPKFDTFLLHGLHYFFFLCCAFLLEF